MVRSVGMLHLIGDSRDIVCSIDITGEAQPEQMKDADR